MGTNGYIVVYRAADSPYELWPDIAAAEEPDQWTPPATGWSAWFFDSSPESRLEDLVSKIKEPALTGYVVDSDTVHVRALEPGGAAWSVWLDLETAATYDLSSEIQPETRYDGNDDWIPPDYSDPEFLARWEPALAARVADMAAREPVGLEGANRAIAWATAAGLTPAGADEIAEIIDGHAVFAEELFGSLIEALGIRS